MDTMHGKILIVDDHREMREMIGQLVALHGHQTLLAANAQQALALAEAEHPDLILMDLMLPDVDGVELTQMLRQCGSLSDVPIIFLSAQSDLDEKLRAFEAGACDYLTKPFKAQEILARIAIHLELYQLRRSLATANAQLEAQVKELARINAELAARNAELAEALTTIKTLRGLLPICAWCGRKVEDTPGHWVPLETYITQHTETEFTHGICPDCLTRFAERPNHGTNGKGAAPAHPPQHTDQTPTGSSQ